MKFLINFPSQSISRRNTRNFSSISHPVDSQLIIHEISINFSSQSIPRRNMQNFSSISHPNRFRDEIHEISHQFLIPIDSQSIIHEISHQFPIPTDFQMKYAKFLINFSSQLIPNQ